MAETKKPQTDGAKKTPSPYDLNSNDNPGNLITQVQLRGENYEEWARAIKISLRARRSGVSSMEPMNSQKMVHRTLKIGGLFSPCLCHG